MVLLFVLSYVVSFVRRFFPALIAGCLVWVIISASGFLGYDVSSLYGFYPFSSHALLPFAFQNQEISPVVHVVPDASPAHSFSGADSSNFSLPATLGNRVIAAETTEWDVPLFDFTASDSSYAITPASLIDDDGAFGGSTVLSTSVSTVTEQKTYIVKKKDTVARIAKLFGVTTASLYQSNPSVRKKGLVVGQKLSLTVVTVKKSPVSDEVAGYRLLPIISGYFSKPVDGVTTGEIGFYNAVDFVAVCGTPVTASAEGVVVPDPAITETPDKWNNGYGNYVLIEHQNGTKTRYSHLESASVSVGDIIKKQQSIGMVGKSGNVSACELGFEVYGARNPFGRY